ncbi:MAG TPA: ribosome silencing factor [Elusimicrobiales bacterium]|nr:ribosome silencing factor [Elusimicrobiales bacterium]
MSDSEQKTLFRKLARRAAQLSADKKARDIKILDLLDKSSVAEFVVLSTVESRPQMEAVISEISVKFKQDGYYSLHNDGRGSPQWQVLDYGGLLVHVLMESARVFYGLDKLLHYAKNVPFIDKAVPAAKPRAAAKKHI